MLNTKKYGQVNGYLEYEIGRLLKLRSELTVAVDAFNKSVEKFSRLKDVPEKYLRKIHEKNEIVKESLKRVNESLQCFKG